MADSYKGIYSTQDLLRRGMAAPGQTGAKKRFWMVWEENGSFRAQPLSSAMEPIGAAQLIGSAEFSARFKREQDAAPPEEKSGSPSSARKGAKASPTEAAPQSSAASRAAAKVRKPSWVKLDGDGPGKTVAVDAKSAAGEKRVLTGKTPPIGTVEPVEPVEPVRAVAPPAEEGASAAAPGDSQENAVLAREQSMRAEFATALTRLRSGQRARAIAQIESLLTGPKISDPAFRHMFTEFGINLRKSKLSALALRTHLEAHRLSPKDSHILFNAARVTYEMNDIKQTRAFLKEALELSPDLEPARRFLDFLDRKTAK